VAISLKTAGSWARMVTDNGTVAILGSPAAGDRMFLFGTWKTYTITVANPSGWTPIGTEFANGTAAAGNGTGSVKVMAWYRDWQSGDADPAIDYSAAPTEGHWVIMLWQKAGGDTWGTPETATGAIASADPFTVDASSTLTIPDASVVMGLVGFQDDETAIARATDAIDDTGALVTWNGNYVESPAAHFNSTTGLDMSGDLGHRLVTTGAAGVTLHMDGDPTQAESGSAKWVVQSLFVSDPKTATPDLIALTTALFAPTVTASDNQTSTPPLVALVTSAFEPTVTTTANQLVTPDPVALTSAAFVPTVTASDNQLVTPDLATLTSALFVPTVTASDHQLSTPDLVALATTTFEPTVTAGADGDVTATPDIAALVSATFVPSVVATANVLAVPTTVGLTLTRFAPTIGVTSSGYAQPATAVLTLTTYRPTVVGPKTTNVGWVPPPERLPRPARVVPFPASARLAGFAPVVRVIDDADVFTMVELIA
jgi:hypothetical protein